MFHDMGLMKQYRSATERFEVDSANTAREFLRQYGIDETVIDVVWDAIALHTTPGIPQHKKPEVALVTAGVETDVLGIGYHDLADGEREAVVAAHPREEHFKEEIIRAFHDGFCDKPDTTFGTVNDDVLALLDQGSSVPISAASSLVLPGGDSCRQKRSENQQARDRSHKQLSLPVRRPTA